MNENTGSSYSARKYKDVILSICNYDYVLFDDSRYEHADTWPGIGPNRSGTGKWVGQEGGGKFGGATGLVGLEEVIYDGLPLGGGDAARGENQDTPGFQVGQGALQQGTLGGRHAGDGFQRGPPAGIGIAPPGAGAGAGGINQDAIEGAARRGLVRA